MPVSAISSSAAKKRDRRLDVFRGLALVTIFINHVPGTVYENFTSRNFGFSDAAEGFVLMSGIAAALAYSAPIRAGDFLGGLQRMWRRAGHLYNVHIVTVMIGLMVMAFGARFLQADALIDQNNVAPIVEDPIGGLIGIAALTHQIGYFNILPLYAVLLFFGPFLIWIGLRSKPALFGLAVVMWIAAGTWRVNFPNYPNEGGWFFNPIAWAIIFCVGLLGGLAMKEGRKLVPYHPVLFAAACGYLAYACLVVVFQIWGVFDLGLPFWIDANDKTFATLPRLLHILALAYVLTNLEVVRAAAAHRFADPLATLGQNGLAVFAAGCVLCIILQVVKESFILNPAHDGALIASALLIQYGIALYFGGEKQKKARGAQSAAKPSRPSGVSVRPA